MKMLEPDFWNVRGRYCKTQMRAALEKTEEERHGGIGMVAAGPAHDPAGDGGTAGESEGDGE